MLFFAAALLVALLACAATPRSGEPWFAAGALLAVLIALPNLLWQGGHGFPMWALLHNAEEHKNNILGPAQYLATQFLITHPLLSPVWLVRFVFVAAPRRHALSRHCVVLLIGEMMLLHGKDYYTGDIYPISIAAGAVLIEAWTARRTIVRPIIALYALAAGIALVPCSCRFYLRRRCRRTIASPKPC